jgi:hypothetical protein
MFLPEHASAQAKKPNLNPRGSHQRLSSKSQPCWIACERYASIGLGGWLAELSTRELKELFALRGEAIGD